MSKLIIPVGIPGSGKSTFSKVYIEQHPNTVIISSDDIRGELFGDPNLQYSEAFAKRKLAKKGINLNDIPEENRLSKITSTCSASVWGTMNYRTFKALEEGHDVIYDATNADTRGRKQIIDKFKTFYDEVVAYYFTTPIDVCVERDSKRDRTVGREVIERIKKKTTKPSKAEGFNEVYEVPADIYSFFK